MRMQVSIMQGQWKVADRYDMEDIRREREE